MALLDHNGESEFPFSKDHVFTAICIAIPQIKGMKVDTADKLMGRIMVKAGITLFSWGENIPIQLIEVNEKMTKIKITSSPKTGIMMGGAFDMGKNRQNIEDILNMTSMALSSNNASPGQPYAANQKFDFPFKKKTSVGKVILYIFLGFIALGTISAMLGKKEASATGTETKTTKAAEPAADPELEATLAKIKAKAAENWPDDYTTQEFWINKQMEDYSYMKEVPAGKIKSNAEKNWPYDFTTQKYWYDQQVEAKSRLN